jgi:hypothetical protein
MSGPTAEIDGEAALDSAEDHAIDALILGRHGFEAGPGFFAAGLVAREHGFAQSIFDALEIDLDGVAGLDRGIAAGLREFLDGDAAFHLEADIDDDEFFFDIDDAALDDAAFDGRIVGEAFGQKGFKVFAGGIHGNGGFRHVMVYPSKIEAGPAANPLGRPGLPLGLKWGGPRQTRQRFRTGATPPGCTMLRF